MEHDCALDNDFALPFVIQLTAFLKPFRGFGRKERFSGVFSVVQASNRQHAALMLNTQEVEMSALKGLTFATYTRPDKLSVEVQRRHKLIAHLQEQLAMARAEANGEIYAVKRLKRVDGQDGSKSVVEVNKRLKSWWQTNANGSVLLTIRYAGKPFEFEKGKAAIMLKSRDELLVLIPKLIAAVEGGEFDAHIANAMKQRGAVGKKAA